MNKGNLIYDLDQSEIARKKRVNLMCDYRMLYAFSPLQKIYHDRDCPRVNDIGNNNFRMTGDFPLNVHWCPMCYRQALVRFGINDDQTQIGAYVRFFDRINASNNDLYALIIEHRSSIRLLSKNEIEITVNDDTWRVIKGVEGIRSHELWHNNYIVLDDGSRYIVDGFHLQLTYGKNDFKSICKIITEYSWGLPNESNVFTKEICRAHEKLYKEYEMKCNLKNAVYVIVNQEPDADIRTAAYELLLDIFNTHQLVQIFKGINKGLSAGQILIYADKCFDYRQMREIRLGLQMRLSNNSVKSYALPQNSIWEMRRKRYNLFSGLVKIRMSKFFSSK